MKPLISCTRVNRSEAWSFTEGRPKIAQLRSFKDGLSSVQRNNFAAIAWCWPPTRRQRVEKVRADQLIDDRILRKIDRSGFIDEVMAKYGVR